MKNLFFLFIASFALFTTSCSKESHNIEPTSNNAVVSAIATSNTTTSAFNPTTLCGETAKTPDYQKLAGKWNWKMTTRKTRNNPTAAPATPTTENKSQQIVIAGNTIKITENGREIFNGAFTVRTMSNGSVVLESEEMQGIVTFGATHNCLTLGNSYRDGFDFYFERQ